MDTSSYIKALLALTLWNDDPEHTDHLQGMQAVGCVIRNRVLAGWEGGNWLTILEKHKQWSAHKPDKQSLGDFGDLLFLRVLQLADTLYSGQEKDITNGALFYCRLDKASEIFIEKIVRCPESHPRTAQVGLTMFFK